MVDFKQSGKSKRVEYRRGESGRERARVEEGFVCRLKSSFEILSEKCVANSCGKAARGDDVGKERFAVLCRMLLIVLPNSITGSPNSLKHLFTNYWQPTEICNQISFH